MRTPYLVPALILALCSARVLLAEEPLVFKDAETHELFLEVENSKGIGQIVFYNKGGHSSTSDHETDIESWDRHHVFLLLIKNVDGTLRHASLHKEETERGLFGNYKIVQKQKPFAEYVMPYDKYKRKFPYNDKVAAYLFLFRDSYGYEKAKLVECAAQEVKQQLDAGLIKIPDPENAEPLKPAHPQAKRIQELIEQAGLIMK